MPAVDPTRLRFQISELMSFFRAPTDFHRRLSDLFNLYANRALHSGNSTLIKPLIPMYQLPLPVFRQMELDLKPHINENPQAALALADELWQDAYYEVRRLSIYILGHVPVTKPEPIVARLKTWLTPELDRMLTSYLFSTGTLRLQEAFPDHWEAFIQSYLSHDDPDYSALGIRGLSEVVRKSTFNNLPMIFNLISPFFHDPKGKQIHELFRLIEAMIEISPKETTYFLKQALSIRKSNDLTRLIKQNLTQFPESVQDELKTIF